MDSGGAETLRLSAERLRDCCFKRWSSLVLIWTLEKDSGSSSENDPDPLPRGGNSFLSSPTSSSELSPFAEALLSCMINSPLILLLRVAVCRTMSVLVLARVSWDKNLEFSLWCKKLVLLVPFTTPCKAIPACKAFPETPDYNSENINRNRKA